METFWASSSPELRLRSRQLSTLPEWHLAQGQTSGQSCAASDPNTGRSLGLDDRVRIEFRQRLIPGDVLNLTTQALMIESSVARGPRHTFFGRLEIVQKPAEDLHAHEYIRLVFTVGKMVAGYTRYWAPGRGLQAGVGGIVMLSAVPVLLAPRYDGRIVPGFGLLLHVRPAPSAP